jgi:hypothetical protein
VPNYRFPEAAVRALALAADRRDWLSRPLGQAPVVEGLDLDAARAVVARGGDARELLEAVGVDPVRARGVRMVADPDLGPLIGVGDEWRLAPLTDVDADELAGDDPDVRDAVVRLAALATAVPGAAPERQRAKTW